MDTFNFPYHRVSVKYPDNGNRVQLGKGYTFASRPDSPTQRKFILKFTGFKYFINNDGTIDLTTNAAINNLGALEQFYKDHQLWQTFLYPHPNPMVGTIVCRFDVPLEIPEGIEGGDGAVPSFDVTLQEYP